ncbi:unnamed protein product [Microthlaspi erraticum]|uniref:Cation efflux protein cytoplasmic domain-containing protein n=1 Tax=Microthlaspi erraticum TaxID=1685480 RepID=A0A6D2JLD4_9BRAS|nr:unnamed protein product [Microthlaspi erraticum]
MGPSTNAFSAHVYGRAANSIPVEKALPKDLLKLQPVEFHHLVTITEINTVYVSNSILNIRAYTFGSHYFVEVDIVLRADMPLQVAHDIGESLQEKLELLDEIERAFVHLDYEYTHKPEHPRSLC